MDGIWETIRAKTEYATFVPRPIAGYERADLRRRDGTPYAVLKNPHGDAGAGLYVRLEADDLALLELMNGERTIQDILVEHLQRTGVFAIDRLARLTAQLGANGFFGEERPRFYERLVMRRALRDPITRAALFLRRLIVWDIARWSNADPAMQRLYRWGGRLAFTPVGATVVMLICAAGVASWISEIRSGRHALLTIDNSYVLGIVALLALQVLSVSVHEAGHALAIVNAGRHVRKLGVAMYYLFPCVYVDSTDAMMSTRRARIVVSLAGPIGNLLVGALCAFGASLDGGLAGGIAFKAASLFIFQAALNLVPILELDGYFVLIDLLDTPLLRQRSLVFARSAVVRKLRRRERWSAGEIGLGVYGVLAIVTSIGMVLFALALWETRVRAAAGELLAIGPIGVLALALLVIVFIGPLLLALAARVTGWVRGALAASAARARRAKQEALVERARLLAHVPFLHGLNKPAYFAIASHLREERADAGADVVTIGEPGDRFYLVRSGRLEALGADGAVLCTIGPGDGFGELALLDRTTRQATVRATEPAVLWSLDRGHFQRWVSDRYEIAARIRASAEERAALAALPFFKGLEPQELDRILPLMRTVRVPAGETVFREGDEGDRYYVIREGEAEVTAGDRRIARIGPGAGFGDLALLFGRPRSATVTARTDLTLAALGRNEFAWLVRESGETVGEFRARTAHYVGAAGLGSAVRGA
ncbi:MAG TPA: cyclic nucleotide-binding domain-containing protein [Candidatus Limnocylindria bacterium]|nr:cyclic nucleotide-binding domain-containing protein [Candidatus Limnocylindria bacterium]